MADQVISEELSVEEFHNTASAMVREVGKVIVGQDDVVRHVLICVIAGGHALLEGVPGRGKTSLIRTLPHTLHLQFSRIKFAHTRIHANVQGTTVMERE